MSQVTRSTKDQAAAGAAESPESADMRRRYRLSMPTFETVSRLQTRPERRDVLQTACQATEFQSFPIKSAERNFLNAVNDHTNIPYHLAEPITEPWHKVFLVVQIDLSSQAWPAKLTQAARKELYGERGRIYTALDKVLRCIADVLGSRGDGRGVSVTLDVLRSVHAGVWEGSGMELLQIEGVGNAKVKRLSAAEVHTVRKLSSMEFYHIERLLSRNPPFGQTLLRQIAGFPLLRLSVEVVGKYNKAEATETAAGREREAVLADGGDDDVWIVRVGMSYENSEVPTWKKEKRLWATLVMEADDGRLLWFWRGAVRKLAGEKQLVVALRARAGEKAKATLACETIVGTLIRETFHV